MTTEEDEEKPVFEKEIKELVRLVYEKARKESMGTTKNAWGNYLEEHSSLTSKTFTRMYDRYILEDKKKPIPLMYSLNSAAEYIGYTNFSDFCRQVFPDVDLISEERIMAKKEELPLKKNQIPSQNRFRKTILGTGIFAAISAISYFGISNYNQPQCMYWKEDHYQEIRCDEILNPNVSIIPLNKQLLEHFHKIEASDTTTFFRAGIPIVWYVKTEGEIEFYSADGKHPLNGKELRKVTPYIIDTYVFANK